MNRRTASFRALFAALPGDVQQLAVAAFRFFLGNPGHPSLRIHVLASRKQGQHLPGSVSVSFGRGYRAIYAARDGVNLWYWVGTHADYDRFTGRK